MITGNLASSLGDRFLTFEEEPVRGSYSVDASCRGAATIKPKGQPKCTSGSWL